MHVRRSMYAYLGLVTASVTIAPLCVMAQTMPPVAEIPTSDVPAPVAQSVAMPPMGVGEGMCNAKANYQTIQTDGSFTRVVANGDEEKVWYATWRKNGTQYWVPTKVEKRTMLGGNTVYTAEYAYSPSPINTANSVSEEFLVKIVERFGEDTPITTKAILESRGTNPTDASRRTEMNYEVCTADLIDQVFSEKK